MTDIVEHLREIVANMDRAWAEMGYKPAPGSSLIEAADEIERLRGQIKQEEEFCEQNAMLVLEARDEIERLRTELRQPRGCTYDAEGRPIAICHELATLRSSNERLRGLLRAFVEVCSDQRGSWTGMHFIDAQKLIAAYNVARNELTGTAVQPAATLPCADCGEPTEVFDDGSHLCWKCRA